MSAAFVISLDFELHWGGSEKWDIRTPYYRNYFEATRALIPEMLQLFSDHGVQATWATVGMLFYDRRDELEAAFPASRPTYQHEELSAYDFIRNHGIGASEQEDPFHFGLFLLRQVMAVPGMEIGSHTFSHYYADEPGQDKTQFRADLRAARSAAERLGITLRSLVMPRNQLRTDYLGIMAEEGFTSVRVNPEDWYWQNPSKAPETFWKRINRLADAYFPNGARKSFSRASMIRRPGEPLQIPASRFLRPHDRRFGPLNALRIRRILSEMTAAAEAGEVYHLWWHPHNFGRCPNESLADLKIILEHFTRLRDKYGMQSLTMAGLTDQCS